MPLVPAKCTQCGANITVDDSKDAAICEFCGTAFVTEKAINNFTVTNHYHADVINIFNDQLENFEIVGGELKKYRGSEINVIIPENVRAIGYGAFQGCKYIEHVEMPDSVLEISYDAFGRCENLKTITLSKSLRKIKGCAFAGCDSLQKVIMPPQLQELGVDVFFGCRSLKEVILPDSLSVIQTGTFYCCISLESVTIPASVRRISGRSVLNDGRCLRGAFEGCKSLKRIEILNPTMDVWGDLLYGCADSVQVIAPQLWKDKYPCSKNDFKTESNSGSGCYVATCVYGSYDCPEVWTLRRFRDNMLAKTWNGRAFIRIYYAISPRVVRWFGKTEWFKSICKHILDCMVEKLHRGGVECTPYDDREW